MFVKDIMQHFDPVKTCGFCPPIELFENQCLTEPIYDCSPQTLSANPAG
jgi:hypothetical protein